MFQKIQVIGNLGRAPETRYTKSGSNVTNFSIATNRKWTNSDGSKGDETIWWRVSAWGRLGEICQEYLTKGQLVFVEGRMSPDRDTGEPRIWTDQNGRPRASFEIQATTVQFLGGRNEPGYGGDAQQGYQNQNQGYQNQNQGYQNQNQGYSQGARQAAPQQRQAAPQQRQAPVQQRPPQSAGRGAPMPQGAPPAQRSTPPRQPAPNPGGGGRRSTMSAPQSNEFVDDNFGPDEIPF